MNTTDGSHQNFYKESQLGTPRSTSNTEDDDAVQKAAE